MQRVPTSYSRDSLAIRCSATSVFRRFCSIYKALLRLTQSCFGFVQFAKYRMCLLHAHSFPTQCDGTEGVNFYLNFLFGHWFVSTFKLPLLLAVMIYFLSYGGAGHLHLSTYHCDWGSLPLLPSYPSCILSSRCNLLPCVAAFAD